MFIDKGNDLDYESLVFIWKDFFYYFEVLDLERIIVVYDVLKDVVIFEFVEVYLMLFGISFMFDVFICYCGKMIGIICCEY